MENLKKSIIIEYLINEIDQCEPKEDIYKCYCDDLYRIVDLDIQLTFSSYKEKFIMKITSMKKNDIMKFCENELFIININKIEEILGRKLENNDYDNYTQIDTTIDADTELYDSDETIDYSFYF